MRQRDDEGNLTGTKAAVDQHLFNLCILESTRNKGRLSLGNRRTRTCSFMVVSSHLHDSQPNLDNGTR